MQLNSYLFILAFFPAVFILYFVLNRFSKTVGKIILTAASALFYCLGGWDMALVMGISILVNLVFCALICTAVNLKKLFLILDIAANVLALFGFKYLNFTFKSICDIFGKDFTTLDIILPVGISFFTFQQIMYCVSIYRGEIKRIDIIDYLLYILYFPKILMGPLASPKELIKQFNDKKRKQVNWENVAEGIRIFCYGLFKKLILADTFFAAVNWGFSNIDSSTSLDWMFIMLAYTFEIYFDFSGYSDMAVGVSKILNIDLPINFDSPYKALSVRDFWKRWHMSLTAFFTGYIYYPLGGSRKGTFRTYLNIMIIFLISGIWHGANWTFILWGLLHGVLNIAGRFFDKYQNKIFNIVKWLGTFMAVNILWLLFRAQSISQWWQLLKRMLSFKNMTLSKGLADSFVLPETSLALKILKADPQAAAVGIISLAVFMTAALLICLIPENNYRRMGKNNWAGMIFASCAFVWSFLCMSSESLFVYFNF